MLSLDFHFPMSPRDRERWKIEQACSDDTDLKEVPYLYHHTKSRGNLLFFDTVKSRNVVQVNDSKPDSGLFTQVM